MRSRAVRLLTLLSLLVAPLAVASSTQPATALVSAYCAGGHPVPCVVSANREGTALGSLPQYSIFVDTYADPVEAMHNTGFTISGATASDLGAMFTVTMDTGSIKPRIVNAKGLNGSTQRWFDTGSGHWMIRIALEPAEMLETCTLPSPTYCPETAPSGTVQYEINPHIDDASWYSSDPAEADKLHGLDQFSNINLLWYPPAITTSSTGVVTMDLAMANSHYYPFVDGHAVFYGKANIRIPNRVLRGLYGIPNPETMSDGSFTSTSTSGSVSSFQELGDDAWRINLTNATFSRQHLRMKRGVIVPRMPTHLNATRIDAHTGKVAFTKSTARGALPTGYKIRCVSGGGHVVTNTKTSPFSPIRIGGLRRGVGYDCKVRATSKAGPGTWSIVERMPARP